jgi:hypothetical protein
MSKSLRDYEQERIELLIEREKLRVRVKEIASRLNAVRVSIHRLQKKAPPVPTSPWEN